MKILLMITRGDSIGGAQVHILDLAVKLKYDKHTVTILLGSKGVFTQLLDEKKIDYICEENLVREINIIKDTLALKNIINYIKVSNPDIIATHSSKAGILGRIAAKSCNIPVTFTAHGWAFTEGVSPKKRFLYKYIEKFIGYITSKIITVSNYDKNLALEYNIASEEKIIAIQNGMNDIEKEFFANPKKDIPTIIMIARFQQPKDHIILIEALNKLKKLDWNLQFVGEDGGLMKDAKDLVKKYNLESRITFLGNRNDIKELLSNSQIFVLTSFWEGFPLTILEAMRANLPVIASNVGGVSEAVINNKTGFVVNGFEELVTSLEKLIKSPELRNDFGEEGRKQFTEKFTFDIMYKKTINEYKKLLKGKL